MKSYWTFERDGRLYDHEFTTMDQAQEEADEGFDQECRDEGGWKNGDTRSTDIELINYLIDDEGNYVELKRIKSKAEFEYYHGDLIEHKPIY